MRRFIRDNSLSLFFLSIFLAALALAQRADLHVTRGNPPPQFVDPTRPPPMQRGA